MSVFIFRMNTIHRTLRIHLSSTTFFICYGHHQVEFTTICMAVDTEVEASLSQLILPVLTNQGMLYTYVQHNSINGKFVPYITKKYSVY